MIGTDVGSQSHGNIGGDDLDDAPEGVPGPTGGIDLIGHGPAGDRVDAAHRIRRQPVLVVGGGARGVIRQGGRVDTDDVADHCDTRDLAEHGLGDGAQGDARSGFPGGGPLQHGAGVGKVVLEQARQVGVARPGPGQGTVAGYLAGVAGPGVLEQL